MPFKFCHYKEIPESRKIPTVRNFYPGVTRGFLGRKEDAVEFWQREADHIEFSILNIQNSPATHLKPRYIAFATFSSQFPCRAPFNNYSVPDQMHSRKAPEPNDIAWGVKGTYEGFTLRWILVTIIVFTLVVFWAVPMTFILTFADLNTLAKVSWLTWLQKILHALPDAVVGALEGFLPALASLILLNLAKPIVNILYSQVGFTSKSEVEWHTATGYWTFLIFNILLISSIGGTIYRVLASFLSSVSPIGVLRLLATSLPQQAEYFISYILVAGPGRLPLRLFRIGSLIEKVINWFFCCPRTARDRKKATRPGVFDYSGETGLTMLIFTITLTYSIMAPLVCVFGFFYFVIAYPIERFNLIFATEPLWQGGGRLFPRLFHHFFGCLALFQIVMLAILVANNISDNSGYNVSFQTTLVVLPIITVIAWVAIYRTWADLAEYGSLSGLDVLNGADAYEDVEGEGDLVDDYSFKVGKMDVEEMRSKWRGAYLQPSLKGTIELDLEHIVDVELLNKLKIETGTSYISLIKDGTKILRHSRRLEERIDDLDKQEEYIDAEDDQEVV